MGSPWLVWLPHLTKDIEHEVVWGSMYFSSWDPSVSMHVLSSVEKHVLVDEVCVTACYCIDN